MMQDKYVVILYQSLVGSMWPISISNMGVQACDLHTGATVHLWRGHGTHLEGHGTPLGPWYI